MSQDYWKSICLNWNKSCWIRGILFEVTCLLKKKYGIVLFDSGAIKRGLCYHVFLFIWCYRLINFINFAYDHVMDLDYIYHVYPQKSGLTLTIMSKPIFINLIGKDWKIVFGEYTRFCMSTLTLSLGWIGLN